MSSNLLISPARSGTPEDLELVDAATRREFITLLGAAGLTAVTIALVDCPGDEIALDSTGESTVIWVYRNGVTDDVDVLARKVAELEFPSGQIHGFVHGEAAEARAVRRHLLGERNVATDWLSASPYWRRDHTDEQWREVKSAWLADQAGDAVA